MPHIRIKQSKNVAQQRLAHHMHTTLTLSFVRDPSYICAEELTLDLFPKQLTVTAVTVFYSYNNTLLTQTVDFLCCRVLKIFIATSDI